MEVQEYLKLVPTKRTRTIEKRLPKVIQAVERQKNIYLDLDSYRKRLDNELMRLKKKQLFVNIVLSDDEEVIIVVNSKDTVEDAIPIIVFKDKKFCYSNDELIGKLDNVTFEYMTNNNGIINIYHDNYYLSKSYAGNMISLNFSIVNGYKWGILSIEAGSLFMNSGIGEETEMNVDEYRKVIYEPDEAIIAKMETEIRRILGEESSTQGSE